MSDDRLDEAIAAYTGARRPPADAAATRSRVLRSAHVAQRRRRLRAAAGIVGALLFSNATTWAWSSGAAERLVAEWRGVDAVVDVRRAEPVAGEPVAVEPVAATAPTVPPLAGPASDDAPAIARAPKRREHAVARAPDAVAVPAPDALAPLAPDALAEAAPADAAPALDTADRRAFEAAHRAHFQRAADAVALEAWDAYLAGFPAGRFVPEATFNRAICLLRLGEVDTARPVLEAIAAGKYGSANQGDARVLLDGLR